jgi:hypothetical protein
MGTGTVRVVRVGKPGDTTSVGQLRPATVLPTRAPGSLQVFQHGEGRSIHSFEAGKGWFFKQDRGTDVVLNIPNEILERLQQKFLEEALTEEQQRKFGCVLMTVAQLYKRPNNEWLNTYLNTCLNRCRSIPDWIDSFQTELEAQTRTTASESYKYWNGYIRSLNEGQCKVNEMYRRKFGLHDNLAPSIQKHMSSKHDFAQGLGIHEGSEYNEDNFNEKIEQLEDSGHVRRKVLAMDESQKKEYLVLGALHTLYLQQNQKVPKIPADANELAGFKRKAIGDLNGLTPRLHQNLQGIAKQVIDKIERLDTGFLNFIQFGSLADKSANKQALKRQVKDSCVLPLNEAVTALERDSELGSVYKIQYVFDDRVSIDSQGPIYTYLFGLKQEVDVDDFTSFVHRVNERLRGSDPIESKVYLELFKGREEEGLWMLSRFMEQGRVNDEGAKAIIEQWIAGVSLRESEADRRKAIVMADAQNRPDPNRLCDLLGSDAEVVRVLTEVPIRVGAGAAHYVLESASIQCLSKYLDNPNHKFKSLVAGALCRLALDAENRTAIREAGGIPKLIQCLVSTDTNLQQRAAGALGNLAVDAGSRTAIREAGGISGLIQCLDSDNIELRQNAAGVLGNLSPDPKNRTAIREAGGISKLIQCLGSTDTNLQQSAAGALGNLAVDADSRTAIREAGDISGLIQCLVQCLDSTDTNLQRTAAGALCELTLDADSRTAIREAGGIPKLINCLDSTDTNLQHSAVAALYNLALDADSRTAIRYNGGISKLIQCLDSDNIELKRNAAGALCRLAVDAGSRTAIREAGEISKLIQCLDSDNIGLKRTAAAALHNLALDAGSRTAIREAGEIPKLIQCLDSDNTELRQNAAAALYNLALDAGSRTAIREAGGIPKLIQLLLDESIELRQNATSALCRLAVDAENKQQIEGELKSSRYELKSPWVPWGKFNIIIKKDSNNRV